MSRFYDTLLTPRPTDHIETALGRLNIEVYGDYTVSAQLAEHVVINRIRCRVAITAHLNTQAEEWHYSVSVDRVVPTPAHQRYQGEWTIGGAATDACRQKVREAVTKPLEVWIEQHIDQLEEGRKVAIKNLLERGYARLDDALEDVAKRRAELQAMEHHFRESGQLPRDSRRTLEDVYRWQF